MNDLTPQQVLDLPMEENDSGANTVRGYLAALLAELWEQGNGFGGKRPFGNSGWAYDLYRPLVKADVIRGVYDEYGRLDDLDVQAGDAVIAAAIEALGGGDGVSDQGIEGRPVPRPAHQRLVLTLADERDQARVERDQLRDQLLAAEAALPDSVSGDVAPEGASLPGRITALAAWASREHAAHGRAHQERMQLRAGQAALLARCDAIHGAAHEWDISARPGGYMHCCEVRDLLGVTDA